MCNRERMPTELTRHIGAQVRARRLDRNMTARELAEATRATGLPLSRSTISKIEAGLRERVFADEVAALAMALGTDPGALMGWGQGRVAPGSAEARACASTRM